MIQFPLHGFAIENSLLPALELSLVDSVFVLGYISKQVITV